MSLDKDPILAGQPSISTGGAEYDFVNLSESVIEVVSINVQLVWVMGRFNKSTTPIRVIKNAQNMFLSEEIKSRDEFWKEHCAASMRELMDKHFHQNCARFLASVPKRQHSDDARKLHERLNKHKDFLNDFSHFKHSAIEHAKVLLGRNVASLGEEDFDKLCTSFLIDLSDYFSFKKR